MRSILTATVLLAVSCVHMRHPPQGPAPITDRGPRSFPLPGAKGELNVEALYFDEAGKRIWVPAGSTGNVDVIEVATGNVQPVTGFQVVEMEERKDHPVFGPSSLARGNGVIFIGNRGSSEVCTIDPLTLTRGGCTTVPSPPDAIAYVNATHELWSVNAESHTVTVLEAAKPQDLTVITTVLLAGAPLGAAVDQERGLFYTTLKNQDRALVIDVFEKKVVSDFAAGCGQSETRGLAVDPERQFAFVACDAMVTVLDLPHGGKVVSHEPAGEGLAHIAYVTGLHKLFAGAGNDARLTEFAVTEDGKLVATRTSPTVRGAKVVVADSNGNAFVADPKGRIIEIESKR
jgi:DNA-binding beta-propeller fold protein YncE